MNPEHEDKRLAIMAELARRAEDNGTSKKFYGRITPVMQTILQEAGADAEEIMGVVQCLISYAASISYGAVASPADIQMRTSKDFAAMAGALWDEACRDGEKIIPELKKRGIDTSALEKKMKLCPSDPRNRPDVAPVDTASNRPPESLEEVMSMINSPGKAAGDSGAN